jgi:hypothetical protein
VTLRGDGKPCHDVNISAINNQLKQIKVPLKHYIKNKVLNEVLSFHLPKVTARLTLLT